MKLKKHEWVMMRHLDFSIILILIALAFISYIAVSAAKFNDPSFADQQLLWYAVGFAVVVASLFIGYRRFGQFAYWFYGLGIILLLLLYVPGLGDVNSASKG